MVLCLVLKFHAPDGSGYAFVADQVIDLNTINPQMAGVMVKPLGRFGRHRPYSQGLMRTQLQRMLGNQLCVDVFAVVAKTLA